MSVPQKNNKTIDIVIDATNVCNWHVANKSIKTSKRNEHNGSVSLDTLLKLVNSLLERNQTFQCIFDANTAYNLPDEEKHIYNQILGEYKDYFYQVTGGIRADSFVLSIAERYNSKVVSNDNFSDYQQMYPWIKRETKPQRLFKGGIPMIAGIKNLVLPELGINAEIEETTEVLFNELRRKLGFGASKFIGMVKSFDEQKGIGHINLDNGEEIYFNRSQLNIEEGEKVDFVIRINDENKTYAADIHLYKEEVLAPRVWTNNEIFEGTIDWFDDQKGFGAIIEKKSEETIFFFSAGFEDGKSPEPEMKVVFEKKTNKKGPYAASIKVGTKADFIILKDYLAEMDNGKSINMDAQSAEIGSLNSIMKQYQKILQIDKKRRYKGTLVQLDDSGGIIQLTNAKVELSFDLKQLNVRKNDLRKNLPVDFLLDFSDAEIIVKNIVMDKTTKFDTSSSPKTKFNKGTKADSVQKEPEPAGRKNGSSKSQKSDTKKGGQNSQKAEQKRGNQKNQKTDSKKGNQNNQKAEQKKGNQNQKSDQKRGNANQESKEKAKATGKVEQNSKVEKKATEKEAKSSAKSNDKSSGKTKDTDTPVKKQVAQAYHKYAYSTEKLVYWSFDKNTNYSLVVVRLKDKENKVDIWTIKEKNLKPELLDNLLNRNEKVNPRTFPRKRTHTLIAFHPQKLVPTGLQTKSKGVIEKVGSNWKKQIDQKQEYEAMKKEITGIYNEVKKATVYDKKIEDNAMKTTDKIIQMVQSGVLTEDHSKSLRRGLKQCYDKLQTLPKEKKKKK